MAPRRLILASAFIVIAFVLVLYLVTSRASVPVATGVSATPTAEMTPGSFPRSGDSNVVQPTESVHPDNQAEHRLTWLGPLPSTSLSGTVRLEVDAPPDTHRVTFRLAGEASSLQDDDGRPWAVELDTRSLKDGPYEIEAVAIDPDQKPMSTARTGIIVNNFDPQPAIVRSRDGDDWYLPVGTVPAQRSGIYGYGAVDDIMTIQTWMATWAEFQRGPNKYNWTQLDRRLSEGPVFLRLKCGAPSHVPAFVRRQHPDWATFRNTDGEIELPQWSRGWVDEWKSFISAFGERYRGHPNFVGFQLQITANGEPFMTQANAESFERLGMTPTVLRDFLLRYHGDTLDAFAGYEWKVLSVVRPDFLSSYSGSFSTEQYAQAVRDATLPMLERGMGLRAGASEQFEQQVPWPEWSEFRFAMIETRDDTFPPLLLGSHLDGQLENWYGANKNRRVTTNDPVKIRHAIRKSLLRALADQYSFLWIDSDDLSLVGRELARYVQLSLGRRPENAPDALLVLGEFDPLAAMPRWLTPLNLNETERGQYMDTFGLGFVGASDYLGRTFDRDLRLSVDDRFLAPGQSNDVDVAITYLDAGGSWHLEYSREGQVVVSPTIESQQTNQWKTVTIRLPAAGFDGQLDGGADLRIVTENGTVTVQVIRVIR